VSHRPPFRPGAVGLLAGALVLGGLALAPAALAATDGLVINEVYGGGGNSGGVFQNDFIELHNTGSAAVDVSTWSVQYASSTGSTWQVTKLTGSIPAGGFYLVQEAGGTGNAPQPSLPTSDVTGSINMSGTTGKVALVTSQATLGCAATCAGTSGVDDYVGWGTATNVEGSGAAPTTSNSTSVARSQGKDSNDNAADFHTQAPGPQNSSTAPADAGTNTDTGGSGGGTTPPPSSAKCDDRDAVTIGAVQGTGDTSAANGKTVTVQGTVVGDLRPGGLNGVDIEGTSDGDDTTSDGIFVFTPNLTGLKQGDVIAVHGKVSEFNGLTEISGSDVVGCGTAALPAPATLPIPSDGATREHFESMLVAPSTTLTVSDVYDLDYYGEVTLSSGGRLITPTEAADTGDPAQAVAAENARRSIVLDDGSNAKLAGPPRQPSPYLTVDDPVRVGDTAQLQPEVLHYTAGFWMLEPADSTWQGTTFAPTNPRPAGPPDVGGNLRIADFNVLNYFVDLHKDFPLARGAENEEEFTRQQTKIVEAISTMNPDIATLHEIENSAVINPPSGEYHAVETLIAALEQKQGLPAGTWAYVPAHEDTDAITNAIIYRTDKVSAVGGPMTPDAADMAPFGNARTPIAQTFHAGDETFSIIANHLKSKGSSCGGTSDASDTAGGNCNGDRVTQAHALVDFANQVKAQSHTDDVLLSGDFNSYRYEDPVDVITEAGYTDEAPNRAPGQYSYVFDGASGSLDHTFASPSIDSRITGMGVWDINAPESFAYEYDGDPNLYAPNQYRASDHNPTLLGLRTHPKPTAALSDATPQRGDTDTVTGRYFTAGTTVQVTVPRPGHPQVLTATVGPDGTVSVPFRVHPGLRAGTYEVTLAGADGERASASFTVADPPESAPGR
jgi:5'-nucleotidase